MQQSLEVADIFRAFGLAYREVHGHEMPIRHLRVMRAIEICRTAEMGRPMGSGNGNSVLTC